jgi:hypothetical protein
MDMAEKNCAGGVCEPRRTQGLQAPAPKGSYKLVSLKGPGIFVGGHVSKQGGDTDLTFVSLDIDGRNVVSLSYAAARNLGFTQDNPFGLVLLPSGRVDNLTFGFPTPLRFEKSLLVSVEVNEDGVVQLLANVVHGT